MENLANIGAEVYAVLNKVPKVKYDMIPQKITELFERYKEQSKKIQIDTSKKFEEQEISKKSKDIIFAISLNYWLTEEERQEVLKKLKENGDMVNEKYDVDAIFKKVEKQNDENEYKYNNEVPIVEEKKKWYIKLLDKLKQFLRNNK